MSNRKQEFTEGVYGCSHLSSSAYSTITPNQSLEPINGKIWWHIDETSLSTDMDKYKIIFAFEQAFKAWEQLLYPIVFQPTGVITDAQIVIRFKTNGDVGLPFPFDQTTLAYAFAPHGTSLGLHADMFINDIYNWSDLHKPGSIYLFKVVVHEIGHCLNLGHQTVDVGDIMYPIYQPNGDVVMNQDTRKGITDLYTKYMVGLIPSPTLTPSSYPSPTPTNTPTIQDEDTIGSELRLFIKDMYRGLNDVKRLSSVQVNTFMRVLKISFTNRDSTLNKMNKIWSEIFKYQNLKR